MNRDSVATSRELRLPSAVTPEMLAKLSGLGVKARTIVEGFVAGLHRSPQHGFSVEFAEHREDRSQAICGRLAGKYDEVVLPSSRRC